MNPYSRLLASCGFRLTRHDKHPSGRDLGYRENWYYALADESVNATVSRWHNGKVSLSVNKAEAAQLGIGVFHIRAWDEPETAGRELPDALRDALARA